MANRVVFNRGSTVHIPYDLDFEQLHCCNRMLSTLETIIWASVVMVLVIIVSMVVAYILNMI